MEVCSEILRSAIKYERRGSWRKVIKKYEELIPRLLAESLKQRVEESRVRMLLYECYFHCGTACYRLQQISIAIKHYESAIKVASQKKINCCVGCIAGKALHLHVPALGKIAICHLQQGHYIVALERIEDALQLDIENPDLFCIKASAWFLLRDMPRAMKDINFAIWLSPKHVCAWLLRGFFKEKKRLKSCSINKDFEMASTLDPSTLAFMNNNVNVSKVHYILDRYLPSLRVSHTSYPEDVLCETVEDDIQSRKKVAQGTTPSATLLRKQCLPTKLNHTIPRVKTVAIKRKEEPFVCGMSTSFHRLQRPQTLSKTKENPFVHHLVNDVLIRTKSAPDIHRIDHFSPFEPRAPVRRLEGKPRKKQCVKSTELIAPHPSNLRHKDIYFHKPFIAFPPSRNRCEGRLLENRPAKSRSQTICYSELTIGDILSARVSP